MAEKSADELYVADHGCDQRRVDVGCDDENAVALVNFHDEPDVGDLDSDERRVDVGCGDGNGVALVNFHGDGLKDSLALEEYALLSTPPGNPVI